MVCRRRERNGTLTKIYATDQAASGITLKDEFRRVSLAFRDEIPASSAVLEIKYSGTMNDTMCGFYRSKYKSLEPAPDYTPKEGEYHYMFSTQFESCDAMRAVPCWDEPNLKASFDFEIEVPDGLTVLSNMPEEGRRPGQQEGRSFVSFERTPIMSTYVSAPSLRARLIGSVCQLIHLDKVR